MEKLASCVEVTGLRVAVIEGYTPLHGIIHGTSNRDERIGQIKLLLREMGRLGVGVLVYNFMPNDDWQRTDFKMPERGGGLVSGYDQQIDEQRPISVAGPINEANL